MIKGKTSSGFQFEIRRNVLDNMELLDAMAEAETSNPLAVSRVCLLILGASGRKALYDHIRTVDGRVPYKEFEKELSEILVAFNSEGKN